MWTRWPKSYGREQEGARQRTLEIARIRNEQTEEARTLKEHMRIREGKSGIRMVDEMIGVLRNELAEDIKKRDQCKEGSGQETQGGASQQPGQTDRRESGVRETGVDVQDATGVESSRAMGSQGHIWSDEWIHMRTEKAREDLDM